MPRPAPAAARAADIVSFLTAHPKRGFTLSELVDRLGINVASAHATLAVLSDAGFVDRDPVHRTYVLGPALTAVGFAALEQHPAVGAALVEAEVLADELQTEILVTALAGRDVIFLARRGVHQSAIAFGYPGDRTPTLAPFGAVFVAWAGEAAIRAWLDRSVPAPGADERYRQILAEVRACGYSVALHALGATAVTGALEARRDVPSRAGAEVELAQVLHDAGDALFLFDGLADHDVLPVRTVTAPIFDANGRVLLALAATSTEPELTTTELRRLGRRVLDSATLVTRRTRGRPPQTSPPHQIGA